MNEFVNRKVDAISVNAIDENAIRVAINAATADKIPVFVHNSLTPISHTRVTEYIGYNQRNGGRACGEYVQNY
jgi:ABC-type sugar transport system substrate-binding protein